MALYNVSRPDGGGAAFNPTTGAANIVYEQVASRFLRLLKLRWAGGDTVNGDLRARLSRDSAIGTGARTSLNVEKTDPNTPTPALFAVTAYGTTPPTVAVGVLFGEEFNANGGIAIYEPGPKEEPLIVGASSIEVRQDIGQNACSFWAQLEE